MVRKAGNASQKRPLNQWNSGNPLEVLKDLTSGVARDFSDDFLKGTTKDLLSEAESLFGLKSSQRKISGTLAPDEVLDFTAIETQRQDMILETPKARVEPAFRPTSENFIFYQKEQAVEQEVQMILTEIKKEVKRLDEATKNLKKETTRVITEEVPPNPGIYHVNFFEWLLKLLKNVRQKVENAGTWLSMLYSRRNQKKYWNRFKKHGTSFGLSGERVVSTQTG